MRHTIDLDAMLAWIDAKKDEGLIYAQSSGKRLILKISGGYRVAVDDKTVYDGTDGQSAVNAYNEVSR